MTTCTSSATVAGVKDDLTASGRVPVEPRLMTLEDVATYLSVSVPQVYALCRSGELPGLKLGGRGVWRVDKRELEAFIQRKQQETEEWTRSHPFSSRDEE